MMHLLRKQRAPSSILGLALDGNRLDGVVLRRSNGSLQVQKSFTASLALNPMTGDPELVGREIRNHLDQAGIRERRCALSIPSSWALSLQTKVPNLAEADVASFLEIEAERGLPYGPDALSLSISRYTAPNGEQFATLVAVPKTHLFQLEKSLKAAQLRPVSFTLSIAALQRDDAAPGVLALAVSENSVDLLVAFGGSAVALRSLDGAIETEGVQKRPHADLVAREIRITLGQLPAEFRTTVRAVRVFGRGDFVQRFVQDLERHMEPMGMEVELVKAYGADDFSSRLPPDAAVSPALSLAARHLTGIRPRFEFLPPKSSSWQQWTTRFSSKKLGWAGATAAAVALLLIGAFLVQQWQLSRLQSKWAALEPRVKEIEAMQQQIKRYRPWFDESFRNLSILRKVTEAFPEDGVVSAKSLEFHEPSTVTCSGVARDNQAFLKMLDQLRANRQVANLKIDQLRGKTPLQFTFNFQWAEGGRSEN